MTVTTRVEPPLRPEWVDATASMAATAAGVAGGACTSIWDFLAALVSAISRPSSRLEELVGTQIVLRAAWTCMAAHIENGVTTHAAAHDELKRIIALLERTSWPDREVVLRDAALAHRQRTLAVRVREYLDAHASGKVGLTDVARALGVTPRRITGEFREYYGISPHRYLTRRRLIDAVRLLQTTDMKVAAVAVTVGFQDHTALYRHCSRLLHLTPGCVRSRRGDISRLVEQLDISPRPPAATNHAGDVSGDICDGPVDNTSHL